MGKNIAVFLAMLVVIALLITVAFTGVDLVIFEIPSVEDGIIPGLDLSGGSIITYEAKADTVTPTEMNTVEAMLRQRLTALGYTEASLYGAGNKRIRIEIPNLSDPEEAVRQIGSTAQLEFRDYTGEVWMTGDMVESASTSFGPIDDGRQSEHHVIMTFFPEYREIWAEVTKFAANQGDGENYVAIYMDNEQVFAPSVSSAYAATGITGDSCLVSFGGSSDAATTSRDFANFIQIGRLPFELEQVQLSTVGPTLGAEALRTSLIAGAIGLGLLILYMLFYYRLPGLMATIALMLYTALIAVILAMMRVNLSLPGIAGIILSIGMATDANIVIFERVKEELRSGKTVRSAVDAGFKRARTAIIDSNLTTMIAGFVLLMFGTGPIQGFATTLLVGVALSMFTALVVTQMLLKQMANLGVVKLWFYGVREDRAEPKMQNNNFSYVKNFKWFGLPSLLICLFTVVCLVLMPFGINLFNFDIDFTGGTSFHFDTNVSLSSERLDGLSAMIADVTGHQPSAPQRVGDTEVLIKMADIDATTREAVVARITEEYPNLDVLEISNVGSSVGADLQRAAILSVIVASALILLYITIRFQFSSGLASIAAQLHDVMVLLAAYVILQIPVNMTFIAVLLTTVGYQINATIILFDRIRENKKKMQKTTFANIIDRSIKQTLSRNINTTLTTLLPVVSIIIIGVPSVRDFTLPIAIGLLAGAYSSITLSGSLWHSISSADDKATKKLELKTIKPQ
ncbi:MAG: protein translocase subunit SecD [Oscillospiraceae bacterium]|jgi:SecD/SecF fusion protein|nr:protein translocase subunit SecD [Oscillospiraceae bacterium]